MTRELKLALIVGFALVLVVTVLISDHLSHARQTRLASLPTEPAKVTEPPPIALENGASTLPQATITEPATNAPAPLIGSMPGTDPEPVIIAQGSTRTTGGTIDLINPMPQTTVPAPGVTMAGNQLAVQPVANQPIASSTPVSPATGTIDDAVRTLGGRIEGNSIYIPGVQTTREPMAGAAPLQNTPAPANAPQTAQDLTTISLPPVAPVTPDRIHVVAGGDNLFKISNKYYSDGKVWRKLAKYNGIDAETPLKVGQKIKVPTGDVLLGKAAAPNTNPSTLAGGANTRPGVTPIPSGARPQVVEPRVQTVAGPAVPARTRPYTIKKGDSLAMIAQRELGTVKRAKDILELNRKIIKNPDNVPLGVTIQLPAA